MFHNSVLGWSVNCNREKGNISVTTSLNINRLTPTIETGMATAGVVSPSTSCNVLHAPASTSANDTEAGVFIQTGPGATYRFQVKKFSTI